MMNSLKAKIWAKQVYSATTPQKTSANRLAVTYVIAYASLSLEVFKKMGTPKIISATVLRNNLYETLKEVSEGGPQIITHKQGGPVVLLSKIDYDEALDNALALKKMAIGLSQIESGKGITHESALKKIRTMKSKWK